MRLGDIYVNKKDKSIIQIDSYATHMGEFQGGELWRVMIVKTANIIVIMVENASDLNIIVHLQ